MATAPKSEEIGVEMFKLAQKGLKDFEYDFTYMYTWTDEYVADVKRTLKV